MTRGAILGRFLPPHAGHKYLIDFGRSLVDELVVLVCTLPTDPIPGDRRFAWMQEMFPNVRVVHMTEQNPEGSRTHPNHTHVWADALQRYAGEHIDYLFASEEYGWELAELLDASFIPVDPQRKQFPVSGTVLREAPLAYWRFIPEPVRPYFARRVGILEVDHSPALLQRLAGHYETVYVSDYKTHYEGSAGKKLRNELLMREAQFAAEDALVRQCNRLLFCAVRPELFFEPHGRPNLDAHHRRYDLIVFSGDLQKSDSANHLYQELGVTGRNIAHVDGRDSDRFFRSCAEVDRLLV